MGKCAVCGHYPNRDLKRSIHGWPQDEDIKKEWLNHLGMKAAEMTVTPESRICSDHFDEGAFLLKKYLRDDAVPKRYEKIVLETSTQREEFLSRSPSSTLTAASPKSSCSTVTVSEESVFHSSFNVSLESQPSTSSARIAPEVAFSSSSENLPLNPPSKKRAKRRLMDRVTNLGSLLTHLQDNKYLSDRAQEILKEIVPTHAKTLFNRMLKGSSRQK
ncbi:unnamed protein product [Ceutorhynchus assimilis]|uniref:THAP-type domain-containing protein n=1 Tax=Ceutorhynchus assimilis TaxID=467358 RepID=A0A9N9MDX2_9CUCU|nr:unnamed protein product [Ceutorhynchus assimilis]